MTASPEDHLKEFDRQVQALGAEALPVAGLREQVKSLVAQGTNGNITFCLVLNQRPFPAEAMMARVVAKKMRGTVDMNPKQPSDFHPIAGLELPQASAYLLWDVDTGRSRLNVSPEESLAAISAEGRSPLTLEEGVMLALLHPEIFTDKTRLNCIQMPGSRIADDQRVPSIWFSKGAPRLGWCWNRNVHTWLASASTRRRVEA